MTDKRQAMVDELLAYVEAYQKDFGYRPTQQELDDFLYTWQRDG